MTLLISVLAAAVATAVWYNKADKESMCLGVLCLSYWGASIMWFIDAVFEFAELKTDYFTPAPVDMLNDAFLGVSVVALGLILWLVVLFIKDPKGVVKSALLKKK